MMLGRGGGGREREARFEEKERRSGWGVAPPSRRLWVGNLSQHASQNSLLEQFLRFGDVENISHVPGRSYAFVNFKKEEDAIIALKGLQGFNVAGMPLRIEFAKGDRAAGLPQDDEYPQNSDERHFIERGRDLRPQRPSPEKSHNTRGNKIAEPSEMLWIGFPPFLNIDEAALRRAFSPFGEIMKITTFPGRSYAFVRYCSIIAACRAKEALQGNLFNNPRVSISFAKSDVAAAELGRSSTGAPFPHFSPSFQTGPGGQNFETRQWEQNFDGPVGEFHMGSPRFTSNFDRISGDMGFDRNSSERLGVAPGPNAGATFDRISLQELGSEKRMPEDLYERHRSSPALERGAPWHDLPFERTRKGRPFEDSWGVEDMSFPLSKKLKSDQIPEKELPEYPFSDFEHEKHDPGMPKYLPGLSEFHSRNRNFDSIPFGHKSVLDHSRNPIRPPAEVDNSWMAHDSFNAGPGGFPITTGRLQRLNPEPQQLPHNEVWKWEGTIAKGGTPVCRARCFPVGKVLDFMLPEFLNCTARTGLDMLARHYYQASSTWVVFFVPETDADITFYNEFMHYLGEKQRAAVAKLGERTTLFLVPPSEFSEKVLKVPGKVSISGVILKFQQPSSSFNSLHQLEESELNAPPLAQQLNVDIGAHELTFRKPNSPDFRTSSQGQNYFSSSLAHLTPVTSAFPPQRKFGDNPSFSSSLNPPERLSEFRGESGQDQLQQQNPTLPSSSWLNKVHSNIENFPSFTSLSVSRSSDNSTGAFPFSNTRVAEGTTSNNHTPETSGIIPLPTTKIPPQLEDRPQSSSSMPLPLQPEQLAQLAALLGQQKQPGKGPALSMEEEKKRPSLSQIPSSHVHASMLHAAAPVPQSLASLSHVPASVPQAHASGPPSHPVLPTHSPSGSLGFQITHAQHYQHQQPNVPSVPVVNAGQESSQQTTNTTRDDTEPDPEKRLQATLQLAAALLQQIQNQSKTGDQH
ncbi:flowering time control protein FPA [Typha angustifolia]|uniref:flowering time control protein FPA n=1 Tax=Typha angustifolia TaxID=59011 RepID=UPI003C2AFA82